MYNVIANLEGSILTLKIDLKAQAKPGKTNGVLIHAQNQDFITVAHLQGREIGLGNLFITSRPDPKLPRPEIKKSESKPEQPKRVLAPAKSQTPAQSANLKQVLSAIPKPEVKTSVPVQTTPKSNPFNLSA